MRRLGAAAGTVAAGGRFISLWSLAVALPLSVTVMASQSAATPAVDRFVAGLATWACFAAALGAIGVSERRLASPARRRTVVVVGVVLAATARPFVQDAWLALVGGAPLPALQLPFRIATNVVVWTVVLTAVALIVDALRSVRETNALLREVLADLDAAHARTDAMTRAARAAVAAAADDLDRDLDALPAEAAAVQQLSANRIRPWSHTLADLADAPAPATETPPSPRPRSPTLLPLRLPPAGIVTVLYLACLLPYAARASSPTEIAVSAVIAIGGGVCADRIARRRRFAARGSRGVFAAISVGIGALLSVIAAVAGAPPSAAWVPALVYPAVALGAAVCTGALHALRAEQRRLTGAIMTEQRAMRAGTEPARAALRRAGELLHRDGQGRCSVFTLEHPSPSVLETAGLVDGLRRVLARVRDVFDTQTGDAGASLDTLVATWNRVIDLAVHVSADAEAAMHTAPQVAQDAYEVVAEGILNSVKHTSARRAAVAVDVIATGAGPHLRVRVFSFGEMAQSATLRPGSLARARGAHLRPTTAGAVLEAVIALPRRIAPDAVVSAEHQG